MNSADQTRSFAQDVHERFEPVSAQTHGTWSWRAFNSYGFARCYVSVPIVLAELHPVASALPVVFEPLAPTDPAQDAARGGTQDAAQGGLRPVALLHLAQAGLSMVSESGAWQGLYVPGALRLHPFACDLQGEDDNARLRLDPQSACLAQTPGQPAAGQKRLFDVNGSPSEAFRAVQGFFDHYSASARATQAATRALWQAGVLKPARMPALPEGRYYTADRAALADLSGAALADLLRTEAMDLAMAQILSLQKIPHMQQVAARQRATNRTGTAPDLAPQDSVAQDSGAALATTPFMEAMARAYQTDKDEIFFKT